MSATESPRDLELFSPRCTYCCEPAQYVAGDGTGFEWYECGAHSPRENLAGLERKSLEPLDQWRARRLSEPSALHKEQLALADHLRRIGDDELADCVELSPTEVEP